MTPEERAKRCYAAPLKTIERHFRQAIAAAYEDAAKVAAWLAGWGDGYEDGIVKGMRIAAEIATGGNKKNEPWNGHTISKAIRASANKRAAIIRSRSTEVKG